MHNWIVLALKLSSLLESPPSPPRGQGLCVTAGHRCEAPGAVQSQEHSFCKAQDQGVVPEQRPGQCFGVIAEQLASEEPWRVFMAGRMEKFTAMLSEGIVSVSVGHSAGHRPFLSVTTAAQQHAVRISGGGRISIA